MYTVCVHPQVCVCPHMICMFLTSVAPTSGVESNYVISCAAFYFSGSEVTLQVIENGQT